MLHRKLQGNLLQYINEVLFNMVKIFLKDTYLGRTTPNVLQNEVSAWWKFHYDKETQVMVNHSINGFHAQFLLKIDALLQNVVFPLYITATFFNNLIPEITFFLTSEGGHFYPRPRTETNNQWNQRLLLIVIVAVKTENNLEAAIPGHLYKCLGEHHQYKDKAYSEALNFREEYISQQRHWRNMC